MSNRSRRRTLERLTQAEYARLRELTDEHTLDASSLATMVSAAVDDRFQLARGMLGTARLLRAQTEASIRRSAASRAYYAAYHAARATVFEVRGRDEDDHEKLPGVIDSVPERPWSVGEQLTYPGPSATSEYTEQELDIQIQASVDQATRLVEMLDAYVRDRRRKR